MRLCVYMRVLCMYTNFILKATHMSKPEILTNKYQWTLSAITSQNKNGVKSVGSLYREPMEGVAFEMLTMKNAGFDSSETY